MNEITYGILGALIAAAALAAGYFAGWRSTAKKERAVPLSKQEKEKQKRERQRMEEEQAAFSMLIGYNQDIAYGTGSGYFDYIREE